MSETPAEAHGRPMKYPYTFSAKIAQFPFRLYWEKSWLFKYWFFGTLASVPIFYKIHKLSNNPENVKKWDETHRKEWEEGHKH